MAVEVPGGETGLVTRMGMFVVTLCERLVNVPMPAKAALYVFFFSSRRRHTRCLSDWSSDVCSSDLLARIKPSLAPGLDVQYLADQSLFVRASISGVIREALIAACLTALMILLFLGSWRSTLVIATSIPLAVLCSIIGLAALGQTLNVMTLSGLALAIGILVDDATVTIENINLNMEQGKEILPAIVDGAAQIATPAFVSTLAISIVFVAMFFLSGAAAALFRPLAMAVVFAVLASYVLSRTIVPTMAHYLLAADARRLAAGRKAALDVIERVSARFEALFERFRSGYRDL